MDINNVTLVGRLSMKPILKQYTRKTGPQAGQPGFRGFCRLAVTRLEDRGKAREQGRRTNFIPIVLWGQLAARCAQFLDKGTEVSIRGQVICESRPVLNAQGQHMLDPNTQRPAYREYFGIQAEDVQFGRPSLKAATPQQLAEQGARINAAWNAATAPAAPGALGTAPLTGPMPVGPPTPVGFAAPAATPTAPAAAPAFAEQAPVDFPSAAPTADQPFPA